MKKTIFLALFMVFVFSNTNAQFKMNPNGNSSFSANPSPYDFIKLNMDYSSTTNSGGYNYTLNVYNTPIASTNIHYYGINASTYCSSPTSGLFNIGIYGQAGNSSTSGFNLGVAGVLIGTQDGAGIYGSKHGGGVTAISGNWAGYFYGDLKVTNVLWVNTTSYSSDQRLKKNITSLTNTYDKISQLNAVQYQYKTKAELKASGVIAVSDTSNTNETGDSNIYKVHFGYIAQEVQNVYPELVYKGADGILGIDYIGLIPLMMEAIKQQEKKITQLQSDLNNCCNTNGNPILKSMQNNTNSSENAVLYQNTPNPFTNETQIKCFIPDNSIVTEIFIYDMQGAQLKKIQINGKGIQTITIQGSELKAGMFMYTLIIDGKEIDTKKMILTN